MEIMRMRARQLQRRLSEFRQSIWFFPLLMSIGVILLFLITSWLDQGAYAVGGDAGILDPLIFAGSGEAARSILSAIASGWATVLSVVFSITLVTIQLSATKYTSQILPQFTKNTLNQLALSSLLASVIYAFLVLKTVRTGDDEFVPAIGVNFAILLAVIALGMVVAFIASIIEFIRPKRFIVQTRDDATRALEQIRVPKDRSWLHALPDPGPAERKEEEGELSVLHQMQVTSSSAGFLASLSWDDLVPAGRRWLEQQTRPGRRHLKLHKRVGDPVERNEPIADLWLCTDDMSGKLISWIQRAYLINDERQAETDVSFDMITIAGVAIKAVTSSADIDVAIESVDALFEILTNIVMTSGPTRRLLLSVGEAELLIDRPVRNLAQQAVEEIEYIGRAAVRQQYSTVFQRISGRYARLLGGMNVPERNSDVGFFLEAVRPLHADALQGLEDEPSIKSIISDLFLLVQKFAEAHLEPQANQVLDLIVDLMAEAAGRSVVRRHLRNELEQLQEKCVDVGLPALCSRINRTLGSFDDQ